MTKDEHAAMARDIGPADAQTALEQSLWRRLQRHGLRLVLASTCPARYQIHDGAGVKWPAPNALAPATTMSMDAVVECVNSLAEKSWPH